MTPGKARGQRDPARRLRRSMMLPVAIGFAKFCRWRLALGVLVAVVVLTAGVGLRLWTWESTAAIRYAPDLRNAWHWGTFAGEVGLLNTYDAVVAGHDGSQYGLDYVPLRLVVAWAWVKLVGGEQWRPPLSANWPVVGVHLAMELAAACGVFAIVWSWLRRWGGPRERRRAGWWALASASVLLLNPASMINSFGRPATDTWVLPFYAWAVWAGMTGRWWVAGAVMGLGAMFKGQLMIMSPVFVLWPLFMGRPLEAVRWLCGLLLAAGVVLLPWMTTRWDGAERVWTWAWAWLAAVGLLAAVLVGATRWQWDRWSSWAAVGTLAAYVGGVSWTLGGWGWGLGMTAAALAAAGAAVWKPADAWPALSGLWGACSLACMALFSAGTAWFEVGPRYGATKFAGRLEMGGAMCLAAIMQKDYRWRPKSVVFELPWLGTPVTMWRLLMGLFVGLLVLTCIAIARQDRRGDRRFLVAVVTPWLVWFAFAAQIHERYLLFGSVLAALTLVAHRGAFVLGLVLSVVSWMMTVWVMLGAGNPAAYLDGFGVTLRRIIRGCIPGLGWGVMTVALVFLWIAWGRTPRDVRGSH